MGKSLHFLYIKTRDRRLRLKPVLVQDTDYMVEKTDQSAPYLWAVLPIKCLSDPYMVQTVSLYPRWNVVVSSLYILYGQKAIVLVKKDPNRLYG